MAKSKQQNQNSQPANMIPGTSANAQAQPQRANRKRPYQQQESNVKKLIPFTDYDLKLTN